MTGRQLNIRLDPVARDRLEALAFVRRMPSSALAREIVLDYVAAHQEEAGIRTALRSRAEHDQADLDEAKANVTKLRHRK